ncbi:unnamed protein product, partial [Protopolystoma xenopodis]
MSNGGISVATATVSEPDSKSSHIACLRHFAKLCSKCTPAQCTLCYRYTLEELAELDMALADRLTGYYSWQAEMRGLVDSVNFAVPGRTLDTQRVCRGTRSTPAEGHILCRQNDGPAGKEEVKGQQASNSTALLTQTAEPECAQDFEGHKGATEKSYTPFTLEELKVQPVPLQFIDLPHGAVCNKPLPRCVQPIRLIDFPLDCGASKLLVSTSRGLCLR